MHFNNEMITDLNFPTGQNWITEGVVHYEKY